MELRFLGAATTVTGSQFLLVTSRAKILIDCGMFQGSPHEAMRNREPLAYDPREIDAILLTHAHLDHCGLLPLVAARNFSGPIFTTAGTVELATLVLLDSAKLQEEAARRDGRRERRRDRNQRRVDPNAHPEQRDPEKLLRQQLPHVVTHLDEVLYTEKDARAAIDRMRAISYDREIDVASGVHATFYDAGHILGSAIIRVRIDAQDGVPERIIVFSGDIGRRDTPIIRDPTVLTDADYVLVESTYGGREHEPMDEAVRLLSDAVRAVGSSRGVLLVPSFAIGRTQEIVWQLDRLLDTKQIPHLPLFLDSPMASKATDIYRRHAEYFDDEMRALLAKREDPLDYPGAQVTNDIERSRAISTSPRPYVIVASNGMLTGGRVLGHLRDLVGDPACTLLFVGYQGEGTLGAHLQAGAKQISLDGATYDVRCQIRSISGFSAHADESELEDWMRGFTKSARRPRRVFITHGDPPAQLAFDAKLRAMGFETLIPAWRQTVTLD